MSISHSRPCNMCRATLRLISFRYLDRGPNIKRPGAVKLVAAGFVSVADPLSGDGENFLERVQWLVIGVL